MTKINSAEHIKSELDEILRKIGKAYDSIDPIDEDDFVIHEEIDSAADAMKEAASQLAEALFAIGGFREEVRVRDMCMQKGSLRNDKNM
jgi:uncharacterized protein Yka (UPF0111/DUF47 family)